MKLRNGYELIYDFPQPTSAILEVNVHSPHTVDLLQRAGVCRNDAHLVIITTFGPNALQNFRAWSDEIPETRR